MVFRHAPIPRKSSGNQHQLQNTQHSTQKAHCSFSRAEAMQMFDHCLTRLRIQPEATVSNTSTMVRLCKFAAEKLKFSRILSKIDSYFENLVLQVIVKREIS